MLIFQSVTIRRAISKNHKASLIGELCHDVSQKYTAAAGEIDVSNWTWFHVIYFIFRIKVEQFSDSFSAGAISNT